MQVMSDLFLLLQQISPVITTLVAGTIVTVLFLNYCKQTNSKSIDSPCPRVPGARPFLGNSFGSLHNMRTKLEEWADKYGRESGMYEFNLFGTRFVVICSEKTLAVLESLRPYNLCRLENAKKTLRSMAADGLFSAEGDVWRAERKVFAPALNRKNLKDYVATVKLVSSRLVDKWVQSVDDRKGGVVTINSDILSCTIDVVYSVAFGEDLNSVNKSDSVMASDLRALVKVSVTRIFSPVPYWHIPIVGQYIDGGGWAVNRLRRHFTDLYHDYESSTVSLLDKEDIDDTQERRSRSFLGKVAALVKKDAASISAQRVVGNLNTMFIAASETSYVTICSSLYEIAIDNSGLQEELAAEVLAFENFNEACLDELEKGLPRLRSLIYEVLRLKGPFQFLGLQNKEPFEINGTVQPPNTKFFILFTFISTLESSETSKNAPRGPNDSPLTEFCARRWLIPAEDISDMPSVIKPSYKTGFRPFGMGVRVCPGRGLAELEVLLMLSSILRKFEISLEKGHPPMKLVTGGSETPNIDIRLMLTPRLVS